MGDATQIHWVIINLCTNADQVMDEQGRVLEVSLADAVLETEMACYQSRLGPGSCVKLKIEDTGSGMDATTLERIFDPYFTTKGVGKGSGLGLAVVHGIVKRHEGSIAVRSEPGRGTVFEIFFPMITTEKARVSYPLEPVQGGSGRVLLVDDEDALATLGEMMLQQLGYQVTATRSSEEAFDLVITDYTMPRMTGVALAAEILRIRPGIPIILCTGYSDRIDEAKATAMGIRAFIDKPVSCRQLAQVVRKVLDEG
jgi:two-component system, cell cycle sensor histidine kinase and response regulator CckA